MTNSIKIRDAGGLEWTYNPRTKVLRCPETLEAITNVRSLEDARVTLREIGNGVDESDEFEYWS